MDDQQKGGIRMAKISDESLKEKYGEVKFLDMIDAFSENADVLQSKKADVADLIDVGFTKDEARYLVYGEQPQPEEEKKWKYMQEDKNKAFTAILQNLMQLEEYRLKEVAMICLGMTMDPYTIRFSIDTIKEIKEEIDPKWDNLGVFK